MIKIFRKIRQTLLSENQFSKYLLYAIGEIVLVVIGILIALQINNWNEDRKRNEIQTTYYRQLLDELELDHNQIKSNLKRLKMSIASYDAYIERYSTPNLSTEKVFDNINKVDFSFGTIEFNTHTIEVLELTVDIRLMPKHIKNTLVTLKNSQTDYLKNKNIREAMSLRIMENAYLAGPLSIKNILQNQSELVKDLNIDGNLAQQIAIMYSGFTSKKFAETNGIWELNNI